VALIMVLVSSLAISWLGATLGDYLAESNKQVEETSAGSRWSLVSLGVAVVLVAFVIVFVTTATPPV